MKKLLLLMVLFAGLTGFKNGDVRHIRGKIFAADDKQPIIGASVRVKGAGYGALSDVNGSYHINISGNQTVLVVSYIGYKTKEVTVGKSDSLNVYLEPSSSNLSEVVVTGYTSQYNPASAPPQVQATEVLSKKPITTYADDESYKHHTENGFDEVTAKPLSTFSVDVDAASYSIVRRFINNGQLPSPDAVRIEEMVNYFKYDLAGPKNNDPVAIHTELSSAPWNSKHRLLRIGLKAKTIDADKLPASNLVFLIDVSGSMNMTNKLPLVKASMKMLVEQLRMQDRVAIVVYASQTGMVLPSTPGDEKEDIDEAIDNLTAGGSTAGADGIKMAYKIAKQNFRKNGNNRIIMCTDGDFNVGPNSDEDMEDLITKERESKVAISIMGFGMGNYKDSKMETLADAGNGNYAYIDNITEAHKALVSEFGGTLFTIAKDVKVQVEFNPAKVQAYRLLGYEDRMLNKEDFSNDKKDAGDMGSGHTVTALYEIVPAGIVDDYAGSVDPLKYQKPAPAPLSNPSDEMMTIKFRYKINDTATSKMSLVTVKDTPKDLNTTSADFRFAASVAEFGMLLRNSQFKQGSGYDQVIEMAKAAKGDDADGYRSEFVRLAKSAKLISKTVLATK